MIILDVKIVVFILDNWGFKQDEEKDLEQDP